MFLIVHRQGMPILACIPNLILTFFLLNIIVYLLGMSMRCITCAHNVCLWQSIFIDYWRISVKTEGKKISIYRPVCCIQNNFILYVKLFTHVCNRYHKVMFAKTKISYCTTSHRWEWTMHQREVLNKIWCVMKVALEDLSAWCVQGKTQWSFKTERQKI